jgi:hypothetical protein
MVAGSVAVAAPSADRGEDRDAVFASVHVAPEFLPGLVTGHAGGVGTLRVDQHHVSEAVVMELRGHRQHGLPVFGAN